MTVMAALGTTASVVSLTVPRIVPVKDWAATLAAANTNAKMVRFMFRLRKGQYTSQVRRGDWAILLSMAPALEGVLLEWCAAKLRQLAGRIVDCLGRLTEEQIWLRGNENSNAVGNLALHLCGNVRQWIIHGVGGAADVRRRAEEFAARGGPTSKQLAERLEATLGEAVAVIEKLTPERLAERVVIQNYDVTRLEAVLHVLEHFAQHTGQILFATKLLAGADLGYYKHLDRAGPPGDWTL